MGLFTFTKKCWKNIWFKNIFSHYIMDFVFEKSIDFYGIFELIYTKKWTTLYLFKIILQYISSWWWCSNSRAIDFHSFLDFLLPILHTSIPKFEQFLRLSALKFLLSRFYDSLIHSASNYNQKRAKIYSGFLFLFQSGVRKNI